MTTITRRPARREAGHPTGRFWIRFVDRDGRHDLTVDPNRCPRNIHARRHWIEGDSEPVLDELHGDLVVLAECLCDHEETSR